jgi:hypothetical protein
MAMRDRSFMQKEYKAWITATNISWTMYQYIGKFDVWRLWGDKELSLSIMTDMLLMLLYEKKPDPSIKEAIYLDLKHDLEFKDRAEEFIKLYYGDLLYTPDMDAAKRKLGEREEDRLSETPSFLGLTESPIIRERLTQLDMESLEKEYVTVFLQYGFDQYDPETNSILWIEKLTRREWGKLMLKNLSRITPLAARLSLTIRHSIAPYVKSDYSELISGDYENEGYSE